MKNKLNILWTSDNVNTAHLMVFMYSINTLSTGQWDEVNIIVWGAAVKLVAEDEGIQEKIKIAKHTGVNISACISCAVQFGVVDKFGSLDVDLIPWAEKLTEIIKSKENLITI